MPETLTDNAAAQRFELAVDGAMAYIGYRRSGSVLYLDHAEVPAQLGGRGLGTRLVRATLELVRSRGERVVPVCSFVRATMERHREYDDLRAP
ncbi:MAG: N-acetyltransferase [Gammaproteobacteria bacterium]|nr:N-acetyltransferase [Gammaproteobacteria bacterium]MDE2249946.1 N-acetyltransferase [Gammaproteobacteria bacterium]